MLDAVDAALVRELQTDGRATFQTLGNRVGLSRTAVRTRVRRLLGTGAVRIVGVISAQLLGIAAHAHVSISVEGPATAVLYALADRHAVTFAALVAGRHAVVAEVRARDEAGLAVALDEIRANAQVRSVDVFRCVRTVKPADGAVTSSGAPITSTLDDIDWRLMRELQRDGRAPYARLSREVDLSQAATRSRVVRLVTTGAVRVVGQVDAAAMGAEHRVGLGVRVRGDAATAAQTISALPGVACVLTGYGRYDIVARLDADDHEGLLARIEAVRSVPAVRHTETWHHLVSVVGTPPSAIPARP